jgi:snurportin-1
MKTGARMACCMYWMSSSGKGRMLEIVRLPFGEHSALVPSALLNTSDFSFWFRDSRLAELPPMAPPLKNRNTQQISENANGKPDAYRFPYPCTFLPIPYDTNTTLPHLLMHTIPLARSTRTLELNIPHISDYTVAPAVASASTVPHTEFTFALPTPVTTPQPLATEFVSNPSQVGVRADGLLLYVAQATYEPGTSPLSSWIPIANYDGISEIGDGNKSSTAGRLELFERCQCLLMFVYTVT